MLTSSLHHWVTQFRLGSRLQISRVRYNNVSNTLHSSSLSTITSRLTTPPPPPPSSPAESGSSAGGGEAEGDLSLSSDAMRLAIMILQKHGGSMPPGALMKSVYDVAHRSLKDEDEDRKKSRAAVGSGINFARRYPTVFAVEWEVRRCGPGSAMEYQRAAKSVRLLPGVSDHLLLERTLEPDPAIWGPVLEEELEAAGGYIAMRAFPARVQEAAFRRGLKLPPAARVTWCIMSGDRHFARIRPVWSPAPVRAGPPRVEGVQLLPKGETVLGADVAELAKLAAQIRGAGMMG